MSETAQSEGLRIQTVVTERRRRMVALRGLLVVAVGGLLADAGGRAAGMTAVALLAAFALSDLLLALLPEAKIARRSTELAMGGVDLVLVGLGIHLAGAGSTALPVSCLLMVLVVALGSVKWHSVAGATAVGALHGWLVTTMGLGPGLLNQLVLQILFLCSVGLYYGFLAEAVWQARHRLEADAMERRELKMLLEILGDVNSSLSLHSVSFAMVSKLAAVVPSVRCSIVFVDSAARTCSVIASHDNPDLEMLELDLSRYPEIRKAIETRRPVVVRDISTDDLMAEVREFVRDLQFHSLIVVPLVHGEETLGTLCLRTARADQDFSQREIDFCMAVARASANALKNAMLHRQVQEESARHRAVSEKLSRIFDHSPELILSTDPDGTITEVNRGAHHLLGFRREEVVGRDCRTFLVNGDEGDAILREAAGSRAGPGRIAKFRDVAGREVEIELHLSALRNEAGELTGTLWIGRDVGELRAARQQLLQAEKLSAIGEVISGVAHELNNPLSAVLGYSELLLTRRRESCPVRELERIRDSAGRCKKIVAHLLSFARAHAPERRYLMLNPVLEKALDLCAYRLEAGDIEVVRELDPKIPPTMLDPHQMEQVFLNLIHNAEHAIRKAKDRPGRLVVRTWVRDGMICAEVSDNGVGMDTRTQAQMFDPFFTTKPQGEGTGLGLSIAYGIVQEHGGRIRASSRPGDGTTFVVDLPILAPKEREAEERTADARQAETKGMAGPARILVVDDEPLIVDLIKDVLEELGHRVDTAADGVEAHRKVEGRDYDLVITDIRMPRMDGMELYRTVTRERPDVARRMIFITGDLIGTETARFLAQVDVPALPKPLEIDALRKTVQEQLIGAKGLTGGTGSPP